MLLTLVAGLLIVCYFGFAGFSVMTAIRLGSLAEQAKSSMLIRVVFWHGVAFASMLIMMAAATAAILFGRLALGG